MSDMERKPSERVREAGSIDTRECGFELIEAREVPLGGVRAMNVRRTLPHKTRFTVGAWCFLDHYGPDDVSASGGMHVPPHPHTGLQTVSWLFRGEIEHRDSLGTHQLVRPGEMNLMTAGRGISHSEVSTEADPVLHGVQLWTLLPEADRHGEPDFSHTVAATAQRDAGPADATITVFIGELDGIRATATGRTALIGAEILLPPNGTISLPVDAGHEHAVLLDAGELSFGGERVPEHQLGVWRAGKTELTLAAGDRGARVVFLGGEPINEPFVMFWNFIGGSHDEVASARERWMSDVAEPALDGTPVPAAPQFLPVPGYTGDPLRAPAVPQATLQPRRRDPETGAALPRPPRD